MIRRFVRIAWWATVWLRQRVFCRDPISGATIQRCPVAWMGRGECAFPVPAHGLRAESIVYSGGIGLDTSFDEDVIRTYGAQVFAFDPTPRALEHARQVHERLPRFTFHPLGLWNEDVALDFFAPENPEHVSHSVTAMHGSRKGFRAECRRLRTLMALLHHTRIDLLKINIEGAEYEVLRDMLASGIRPETLVVVFDETHSPRDGAWRERIGAMTHELLRAGYQLAAVRPKSIYMFRRVTT